MSLTNIGLLLSFIAEGVKAIQKFIQDEEVKKAFSGLQNAQTTEEKQAVARNIASLLYK
jgi:hypothetical protein